MNIIFNSFLSEEITTYIDYKRTLGRKYNNEEKALGLFDRYLIEQSILSIDELQPMFIDSFLNSRPRNQPKSYNHLLGVIRCFFDWLIKQERLVCSPVKTPPKRNISPLQPFLFKPEQVVLILKLTEQLPDNPKALHRNTIYTLIFSLMYGLGLRVGETVGLQYRDVNLDRQFLEIRKSKFGKTRLVPFGPQMGKRITEYLAEGKIWYGQWQPQTPVFSFTHTQSGQPRPICIETVSMVFHKLMLTLNFNIPSGVRSPHLHCLRHSFAVETLLYWYRNGMDPNQRLFHLSTFMGHVDPLSTAWYLTITDALLNEANHRFESFESKHYKEDI